MYTLVPHIFYIHDVPSHHQKGQEILHRYLCEAHDIFKKELGVLCNTSTTFTQKDEEKLLRMLTLIIEARKAWQEEETIS